MIPDCFGPADSDLRWAKNKCDEASAALERVSCESVRHDAAYLDQDLYPDSKPCPSS